MRDELMALLFEPPVPFKGRDGIHIRVLSAGERERWLEQFKDVPADGAVPAGEKKRESEFFASLVVLAACDQKGDPLFDAGDMETLINNRRIGHKLLKELFDQCFRVNRVGHEAVEAEKKDSSTTPVNGSGLSSPEASA